MMAAAALLLLSPAPAVHAANTAFLECPAMGQCGAKPAAVQPTESHDIRCCSDRAVAGWQKHAHCEVWTPQPASSLCAGLSTTTKTYEGAKKFCAKAGGRLCTVQELQGGCARLYPAKETPSGTCGSDLRLVWAANGPMNCHSWVGSAGKTREIRLGFLGPYNSPINDEDSVGVLGAAFAAAVTWLNADPSHLFPVSGPCNSTVTIVPHMLDSSRTGNNSKVRALQHADELYKCPSAGAPAAATAGVATASAARPPAASTDTCSAEASLGRNVHAVIADQWSSTVSTIGMMAEIHRRPMVGYGATSDALSNKHDYPFFSRVTAPDRYQAPYIAKLVKAFGWLHVGVLNGDGSYAAGLAAAFARGCSEEGVTVEERFVFEEGKRNEEKVRTMLTTMKDAGVRVIFLASAGYVDTEHVLRIANSLGMAGPGYVWVGGDGWMATSDFKDFEKGKKNPLREYLHGAVGIFPYTAEPSSSKPWTSEGMAQAVVENMYTDPAAVRRWRAAANKSDKTWRIPQFDAPYDKWANYVWDAVVHVARTAALATDECLSDGECLQDAIRNSTTVGATGTVQLDAAGDRKVGSYAILNVQKDDPKILVPVGSIIDGVVTFDKTKILWPEGAKGGAIPSDGDWAPETVKDTGLAVRLALGFGIPAVLLAVFLIYYRHVKNASAKRRKIQLAREREEKEMERREKELQMALKEQERRAKEHERGEKEKAQRQLADLQESMQSMAEVQTPWKLSDGTQGLPAAAAAPSRDSRGRIRVAPAPSRAIPLRDHRNSTQQVTWYWEEDSSQLHKHNKQMVRSPNWVEYSGGVAQELEEQHKRWKAGSASAVHTTDLNDRISTTGNEQKANNAHTGTKYKVHFDTLEQENAMSGFKRKMLRHVATVMLGEDPLGFTEFDTDDSDDTDEDDAAYLTVGGATAGGSEPPLDFSVEDALTLKRNQLIQVNKKRKDGFWHGSVIFDASNKNNSKSGWFPGACLRKASPKLVAKFQISIGGAGADALAVPRTWSAQQDKTHAQLIPVDLSSREAKAKVQSFMATLSSKPTIVSLSRVQNVAMWQSYAVKKITMMNRTGARSNWERHTLFHGTDEDTAKKIIQQGFNRNFSGLNATAYGKGVYFARDAKYSSSQRYARPNRAGVQSMFLCRVLVGEYCFGRTDVKAPDVADSSTNRLYDTTVDNINNPSIFVAYHDAQVYPEYLITFKQ